MCVAPEVETDDFYESPRLRVLRDDSGGPPGGATPERMFLHGFSQNADCAGEFVQKLRGRHVVGAVDLPGHPRSPGSAAPYDPFWATAARIAATAGRVDYIGYSMGGRITLHVALAHPESVRRLVLIGSTAGIEDPAERTQRRRADSDLAARIEHIGVEAFVEEWLNQPLFSHLPESVAFREQRLTNTAGGLAWSLRNTGTGSMRPLWSRLSEITCPVLVIAGGDDERYTALGRRLVSTIGGNAELAVVGDVGHAVHLEAPDETARIISEFFERDHDVI